MRISFLILFFWTLTNCISQDFINENRTDSLNKTFSFGWANTVSLLANHKDNEKLGFYSDLSLFYDQNKFLKVHVKFHPQRTPYTIEMNHFLAAIEKGAILKSFERLTIGHGFGGYYRCHLLRTTPGQGIQAQWNATYHGFGIQYHIFSDVSLKENWFLNILVHLNAGFHQNFASGVVNASNEVWELKSSNQQLLSVGIKKRF